MLYGRLTYRIVQIANGVFFNRNGINQLLEFTSWPSLLVDDVFLLVGV